MLCGALDFHKIQQEKVFRSFEQDFNPIWYLKESGFGKSVFESIIAQKSFVPNRPGFANLNGFYRGQNFSKKVYLRLIIWLKLVEWHLK